MSPFWSLHNLCPFLASKQIWWETPKICRTAPGSGGAEAISVLWECAMRTLQIPLTQRRLEAAWESCLKPRMGEKTFCSRGWCADSLGWLPWLLCNGHRGSLLLIFSPQGMELARKGRGRVLCVLCSVGATSLTPARECVFILCIAGCVLSLASQQGMSYFKWRAAIACSQAEFGKGKALCHIGCYPKTTGKLFQQGKRRQNKWATTSTIGWTPMATSYINLSKTNPFLWLCQVVFIFQPWQINLVSLNRK